MGHPSLPFPSHRSYHHKALLYSTNGRKHQITNGDTTGDEMIRHSTQSCTVPSELEQHPHPHDICNYNPPYPSYPAHPISHFPLSFPPPATLAHATRNHISNSINSIILMLLSHAYHTPPHPSPCNICNMQHLPPKQATSPARATQKAWPAKHSAAWLRIMLKWGERGWGCAKCSILCTVRTVV